MQDPSRLSMSLMDFLSLFSGSWIDEQETLTKVIGWQV